MNKNFHFLRDSIIKTLLTFLFTLALGLLSYSQDSLHSNLIFDNEYSENIKGIYASSNDFWENNPIDTSDFIVKHRIGIVQLFTFSPPTVLKYYDNKAKKYKKVKGDIWGAYDGETIYIQHANKYSVLNMDNRFCDFEFDGWFFTFVFIPIPIPVPAYYKHRFIYDIVTDKRYFYKKDGLRELLTEIDPNLLPKFEDEKKKKDKIETYIDLLNKKYNNK